MEPFDAFSLRYDNGVLVLDQRCLPQTESWLSGSTIEEMFALISTLAVRGAPMIGVAAATCLAHVAHVSGCTGAELKNHADRLETARPTAVNLAFCCHRVRECCGSDDNLAKRVAEVATELRAREVAMCSAMSLFGASLVSRGESLMTICNTGSLAVPGMGTALGVIRQAYADGTLQHVYVCETRPLLQGGRLTAYELTREKIPFTLITDSMAASVMRAGRVHRVVAGADRIARNGDSANKIGTYSLAVLARFHKIPFHIVAPASTIDAGCATGADIPIEERAADEVRGAQGHIWAPKDAPCFNPAFDVTPMDLITSIILDTGVYTKADLDKLGKDGFGSLTKM